MERAPIDSFVDKLVEFPSSYNEKLSKEEKVNEVIRKIGGNVDIQDEYGNTILHHAVKNRDIDICRILLKRGADPNIINQEGNTPLIYCVFYSTYEITLLLLEYGGDPRVPDSVGENCFDLAKYRNELLEIFHMYCSE
jgi:ankyrin repeat protein